MMNSSLDFKSTLNIIKSKVTLNQVIESYGIQTSATKLICCPLHSEEKGSFKIYDGDSGEGSFWCFGCQKGGDMLTFVEHYEGISKSEALHKLAAKFKVDVKTREYSNDLLGDVEKLLKPKPVISYDIMKQLRASAECNQIFASLTTAELTPYLEKKQIPHLGTKSRGDTLVIPVCSHLNQICGLQYILADGSKIFHPECKRKGCMYRLGLPPEPNNICYLAEGYSTAASVFLATERTVYVCFSSNNFETVYNILSGLYPQTSFIVAGDNDESGKQHCLDAIYPLVPGKDWNDIWCYEGPSVARQQLLYGQVIKGIPRRK